MMEKGDCRSEAIESSKTSPDGFHSLDLPIGPFCPYVRLVHASASHTPLGQRSNTSAGTATSLKTAPLYTLPCLPRWLDIVRMDQTTDAQYTINRLYGNKVAACCCLSSKVVSDGFFRYGREPAIFTVSRHWYIL